EPRRQARDLDRDGRSDREDERVDPALAEERSLLVRLEELFPEPAAVLARELTGNAVELTHPLHGDEECLIGREPGRAQLVDLVAEVVLELGDVVAVDGRGLRNMGAPLG